MAEVAVLGLGYIGLPTAAILANKGVEVLGVDINRNVIETLKKGEIHIFEPDLKQIVNKVIKEEKLKVAAEPQVSDTYLVVVPTPFKENHEPDISFVEAAVQSIIPILKQGDLIIIESTSPIGTTDKMLRLVLNQRPELEDEIYFAYCPERVLPGRIIHELVYNDRVIGGVNKVSTEKAIAFYKQFVRALFVGILGVPVLSRKASA